MKAAFQMSFNCRTASSQMHIKVLDLSQTIIPYCISTLFMLGKEFMSFLPPHYSQLSDIVTILCFTDDGDGKQQIKMWAMQTYVFKSANISSSFPTAQSTLRTLSICWKTENGTKAVSTLLKTIILNFIRWLTPFGQHYWCEWFKLKNRNHSQRHCIFFIVAWL